MNRSSARWLLAAFLLTLAFPSWGSLGDRGEHETQLPVGAPSLSRGTEIISSIPSDHSSKHECGEHYLIDESIGNFSVDPYGPCHLSGWTSHDLTESEAHWRVSTTNSDDGFSTASPTNHGLICNDAGLGYGNLWDAKVSLRIDVTAHGIDPFSDVVTVRWQSEYKVESEPNYDFTRFEWKKGAAWQLLLAADGSTYNDGTGVYEALVFDSDSFGGISYGPGDYVDDRYVELRVGFLSDGGYSDEDGIWTSQGRGATALDNIVVSLDGTPASNADFEGGSCNDCPAGELGGSNTGSGLGCAGWQVVRDRFGDFAKLVWGFQDIDPCYDNQFCQLTFLDDGTPPNNHGLSTGGSLSPNWSYGVPGGYVINYTNGVSEEGKTIWNEAWSPEINWDLAGTQDDAAFGAMLSYWGWSHLPLENGIFSRWRIRCYRSDTGWSSWTSYGMLHYDESPGYRKVEVDISTLLQPGLEKIQVSLGVVDLADVLGYPGEDATPSPTYDYVRLYKYCAEEPVMSVRNLDLASDGFPNDGTLSGSIRFDSAQDIASSAQPTYPLDCIPVRIKSVIPGADLADPATGGVMRVAHLINPRYGSYAGGARAVGFQDPRIEDLVDCTPMGPHAWEIYCYTIRGTSSCAAYPGSSEGRYYFDLPDGPAHVNDPDQVDEVPVFFPGDIIHYYFEAEDTQGNVATLPTEIEGFRDFEATSPFDERFTVHGLPTQWGVDEQPRILFWNDAGHRGGDREYAWAFAHAGMRAGYDYDVYTTRGASSHQGNGLGSAGHHGANASQLAGYESIIYVSGDLRSALLSDGTNSNGNDKSDDLSLLEAWHAQAAPRRHVYFGDNFVSGMTDQGPAALSYLNAVLGVSLEAADVGPSIQGQMAPVVIPTGWAGACFLHDFVTNRGCPEVNDLDHIAPFGVGPLVSHEFSDPGGNPTGVPMGIWWDRLEAGQQKITGVFDCSLERIEDSRSYPGTGVGVRGMLLREILDCWGLTVEPAIGTPNPPGRMLVVEPCHPNPFNPRTSLRFHLGVTGRVKASVYDLRGRRVRALLDEDREAGPHTVLWDGTGDDGVILGSGIYLCRFEFEGHQAQQKLMLLK